MHIRDIESYIDKSEADVSLRCLNWCVDVYLVTEQMDKAILAKWKRATYLQRT